MAPPLDVDHFKRFDDQQGHAPGDNVLREMARICTSNPTKSTHLQHGLHTARLGEPLDLYIYVCRDAGSVAIGLNAHIPILAMLAKFIVELDGRQLLVEGEHMFRADQE